jgi:hypothetical protein
LVSPFNQLQVSHRQFKFNDFRIADGVNSGFNMGNCWVGEAADEMQNCVHASDVAQELVSQPLTLVGISDETCDVNEFEGCGHNSFLSNHFRQLVWAWVRDSDDSLVRLNGAKRVITDGSVGFRQSVKNC